MPKASKKKARVAKKARSVSPVLEVLREIYSLRKYFSLVIVIVIALLAVYVRMLPAFKYGFELHANDPWIEYWLTDYLVKHGLSSWFSLTPANPDTHLFWYPWGRDFVHDEYPLAVIIAAATYPIGHALGMSVKQWLVIEPPIFGFLMVISAYLLAREIAGELAGIIAALFAGFTPGAVQRTIAGFVEKEGIALPFILLSLYFVVRLLKHGKLRDAVAGGVLAGLVAWTWGGYQALCAVLAIIAAFYPLVARVGLKVMRGFTVLLAVDFIVSAACPAVRLKYFATGAGLLLIGGVAALIVAWFLWKLEERGSRILVLTPRQTYIALIIIAGVAGLTLMYTGKLSFSGRVLAFLGKHFEDPLVASVSEHQILPARAVFRETGGPFILSIVYLGYALMRVRKESWHIALMVPVVLMLYSAFSAAYLMQSVATILAVGAGAAMAPIARLMHKSLKEGRYGVDTLSLATSIVCLLFVVVVAAAHAKVAVAVAESNIPTIKAGGLDLAVENRAWEYALGVLRNETSPNSVVIAWWDYGYWISVGAHRATVADGATCNSTQIRLLAKALTAQNETEAVDIIFSKFKAPPNDTYLVIFDIFRSASSGIKGLWLTGPLPSPYTGTVGMGDIPKSIWMLRIGGRIGLHEYKPYFTVRMIPFRGGQVPVSTPDWENPIVQNTLIYRLFVLGVSNLGRTVVGNYDDLANTTHLFTDWTSYAAGNLTTISLAPYKHFIPYKTAVDMVFSSENEKVFVAVFIFKVVP